VLTITRIRNIIFMTIAMIIIITKYVLRPELSLTCQNSMHAGTELGVSFAQGKFLHSHMPSSSDKVCMHTANIASLFPKRLTCQGDHANRLQEGANR